MSSVSTSHLRTWAPLLDGTLARQAATVIDEIADALRVPPPAWAPPGSSDATRAVLDATLAGGKAGHAVLFATLAGAHSRSEDTRLAAELIGQAARAVAEVPMSSSLFSGVTGVAWAVDYVSRSIPGPDTPRSPGGGSRRPDSGSEIDRPIATYLDRSPWADSYDLVTGLVGLGVYALDRLPRPEARVCAERVVLRLDELAEYTPKGITWLTPPELLVAREREHFPDGYYNFGLAHGVPGVIALLARSVAAGVETRRALPLLEGAVAWVLAHRGPEPGRRFPFAIAPGVPWRPARTAWCYGDPGVVAALTLAARLTRETSWTRITATHAVEVAGLEPESCGVEDAGLCHGAMGLAHLYHRIHRYTGIELIAHAARRWFEIGLAMRRPGTGVAGFPAFIPDAAGVPHPAPGASGAVEGSAEDSCWAADPGLLGGAAGVALALLAATDDHEPGWDVPLLLSAP